MRKYESFDPYSQPATDIQKLKNSIHMMEKRGITDDARYSQARELYQSLMSQQSGSLFGLVGEGTPPGSLSTFQNPQLLQLRAQIMAYRMLGRHQPLPAKIALASTSTTPTARPMVAGPQSSSAMITHTPSSSLTGSYSIPPIKPNPVTYIANSAGIDPAILLQEREKRLAGRIAHKIDRLTNLPMNMEEDVKMQAEIELRALRLLHFPQSLQAEVVSCTRRDSTQETAINVEAYKRTKRQGLSEVRLIESLEKQQRWESERKRRAKYSEYINAVLTHSREMQHHPTVISFLTMHCI